MSLVFRVHALERMAERSIGVADVEAVLERGVTIEDYPDDSPYPSRLVLGWVNARPLHVVAADNRAEDETVVITAYEPDPEHWEPGFEQRKSG